MNALAYLPWLLVVVPLAELFLLIKVGGYIGALATVAVVVCTAVLGIALVRSQGISTLRRTQRLLEAGELPALELFEGLVLLIAGAFLLTPGFLTDTLALLMLVAPLRRHLLQTLIERGLVSASGVAVQRRPGRQRSSRTIEGEYRRHDD